jgi:hypothetical protein
MMATLQGSFSEERVNALPSANLLFPHPFACSPLHTGAHETYTPSKSGKDKECQCLITLVFVRRPLWFKLFLFDDTIPIKCRCQEFLLSKFVSPML